MAILAFVSTNDRSLSSGDAAERAHLIKAIVLFSGPAFVMLGGLWFFLQQKGVISSGLAFALVLLDAPLAVVLAVLIHRAVGQGSETFVNTVFAWGGSAPKGPATFPRQDALLARGQFAEAADYFRDHLRVNPKDLAARLRLAELLEKHLQGADEAERLYNEVRRMATDRNYEFMAANGLIDLYRRGKRTDRLRVELARFAERFKGSAAAVAASRELQDLKTDIER
jgi:tetratricopeptide (TPR) repeat protein